MKIGFFGKLPGYGDFIQRNVSPDIVNHWDNWLMASLDASREQLEAAWRGRYFNSPIWRFVIDAGIISEAALTGLVMPSVDKSGRCFPFSVICQPEVEINPFILARKCDSSHQKVEDFVLSLLESQRPDLDEICDVLSGLYSDVDESQCTGIEQGKVSSTMELATMADTHYQDFSDCNDSLLALQMVQQNIRVSIWSMIGDNAQKRYYAGLPPADNYHTFLVATDP